MEDKINQILMNQSTIMVTLAALYADECDNIEVLNQLNKRHEELSELLSPTKPKTK